MLLLSSYLQNPQKPPVENAAVWISGDTIRFAGPRTQLPAEAQSDREILELADVVLLPGLVNAHAHLELTALEGLPYPGSFVEWIREVLKRKNNLDRDQQKKALAEGVRRSLAGGTTTLGDHISVTEDLESLLQSPLRGKAFLEIIGVVPEVARDILDAALSLKKAYQNFSSLLEIIPSPHSVHALSPEILAEVLRQDFELFSMHLGESEEERLYFQKKSGPLFDFISGRGSVLIPNGSSALQELFEKKLLDERILAIHANHLSPSEMEILKASAASIVHCPLSHRYFSHRRFPMEACLEAGINIALGTDSLASSESLSMFDVMRAARDDFQLSPEKILEMATLGGAKGLKLEKEIGEIAPGKKADMIAVPHRGNQPLKSIFEAEKVCFSMIGGKTLVGSFL